jgi:hypothetical protein
MLAKTEQDKPSRELVKRWTAEISSKCQHCGA